MSEFFPQGECMQELCDGQLRRPGEAYAQYVSNRQAAGLPEVDYYFSTTITSGGFFRDPARDFSEGMQLNHELARGLVHATVDRFSLDESAVILPSDLGKVAGWSQADFLLYWVHILRGSEPNGAVEQDERFQDDYYQDLTSVMSSKSFGIELRKQAYRELIGYMRGVLNEEQYPAGIHNRPLLIPVVDAELSLGCEAEKIWTGQHRRAAEYRHIQGHVSEETARLARTAELLGVNVMGATYNRTSAQAWADYHGGMLVET